MINELIKKARKIEETTDANLGGAFVQITNELTLEECKELFMEFAGDDPKKIKKWSKKISRVESNVDPRWFNLAELRNDAMMILEYQSRQSLALNNA